MSRMLELAEVASFFRELERICEGSSRYAEILYQAILSNVAPYDESIVDGDEEQGDANLDAEEIDDQADLPFIADEALEIVELVSVSSGDSGGVSDWGSDDVSSGYTDSGYCGSNSNISSFSEFSSASTELRYNEQCHFGYLVAPEHVVTNNGELSESQEPAVTDWFGQIRRFTSIISELEDSTDELGGPISVRDSSSDASITRSRKRKREDHMAVMKSSSEMCIDDSFKKRRLV